MTRRPIANKSRAIRSILKRRTVRNPIAFAEFHRRVEQRIRQIIGKARLKRLVSVMKATTDPQIQTTGRADTLAYWWKA